VSVDPDFQPRRWPPSWSYKYHFIQIPFHQSLVAIGPVVSEEKIKVYDVQQTPSDGKSSYGLWPGELKKEGRRVVQFKLYLFFDTYM
jgi:hypothetical protein